MEKEPLDKFIKANSLLGRDLRNFRELLRFIALWRIPYEQKQTPRSTLLDSYLCGLQAPTMSRRHPRHRL